MSLRAIYGHRALLNRLEGALTSSRFPQSALFAGRAGVGKQRLALWVAQGLLCAEGTGAPCCQCSQCRQVDGLVHPDLHWLTPIARPKATDPAKQIEDAQELLAGAMAERRDGLWGHPEGMVSHPLASIRLLQRIASKTPFSGARKVIVVGDAEWLVVQESSPEAANALLKLLEEPPADTTIIVTAADPQRLLPTIRSRLVTLRVAPVGDQTVREFLENEQDPAPKGAALERAVLLAEGAVGRAIGTDRNPVDDARAERFLAAVGRGDSAWLPTVLGQAPWSARGDFTAFLDSLALNLRTRVEERANDSREATRGIRALRHVEQAREEAQGNVNPQLTLAVLAADLEALV